MSRADATELFESGLKVFLEAKSPTRPPDYEELLLEATRCFDHAISLTEEDDPSYGQYAQFCASAHAACLLHIDFCSEIDAYVKSSSLIRALPSSSSQHAEGQTGGFSIDDRVLDDFWNGLDQVLDRCSYAAHPDLVSRGMFAAHVDSFSEAISHSSGNLYLEEIWQRCRATVLYMRMEQYNPDEFALCIASILKTIRLNDSTSRLTPTDTDHTLLQTIEYPPSDNSLLKARLSWLSLLASFYTHKCYSTFQEILNVYVSDSSSGNPDEAIAAAQEALAWTRNTNLTPHVRFELLLACGRLLHERHRMNGATEDLEDAIASLREAMTHTTVATKQLAFCQQVLAAVLADLATLLSEDNNSDLWLKSHLLWRESVGLSDPEAPELAQRLFELGKIASNIYTQTDQGTSEHASEAAEALTRAAAITTSMSLRAEVLFERASVLYSRFQENANREDFEESLASGETACQSILGDPALIQQNLYWSGIYIHAYRLMRRVQENIQGNPQDNLEDLQKIIGLFEKITHFPHQNRQLALNRLGKACTLLYRERVRAGQNPINCMPILERALESHESALKATPVGGDRIGICHAFLGLTHLELSRVPGQTATSRAQHLDLAISYFRQAKQKLNPGLSAFTNLAGALEDRYEMLGRRQDLDECVSLLIQGAGDRRISHPKQSFKHSMHLVQICHKNDIQNQLVHAYRILFKSLRRLSHLGLTSTTRQRALEENSIGHACDAAASSLTIGDPISAIELLEEGRSLFFSQLLPTQIDTNHIRPLNQALASKLDQTLDKVKQYSKATDASSYQAAEYHDEGGTADDIDEDSRDINPESMQLTHYAQVLQRLLEDVRELPGYEDFMQLKPYHHLKRAAQYCPVVYVNISQLRCDALVLGKPTQVSEVLVIQLPTSWAKIRDLSRIMQSVVRAQGREIRDSNLESARHFVRSQQAKQSPTQLIGDVLKHLWDMIVYPVLSALGFVRTSSTLSLPPERLPHICWCPSGPLATSLPIHAAGNYNLGPEHWATTHVVSSYTSTLSSLVQALERKATASSHDARMLLISQPASPPSRPLPCVNGEKDGIVAAMNQSNRNRRVTVLHDQAGRVADTISALPTHEMLHLACHGKQDKGNPLESAILLHDGQVTLREIIKTPLPSAELVYLSACQTAMGDINIPDESLSLAGGFLFAGYRGAVATMWSINDQDGADIAKSFYNYLLKQDGPPTMSAALALYRSVQDLRAANPNMDFIRWIPFMYLGVTGGATQGGK